MEINSEQKRWYHKLGWGRMKGMTLDECIKQWNKKHYPVPAKNMVNKSWTECIEHSLEKWEGGKARPPFVYESHMTRLGVNRYLVMSYDTNTCALCLKSVKESGLNEWLYLDESICSHCPVVKATGKTCSCVYNKSEDDPQPMIDLLGMVLTEWKKRHPGKGKTTK